MLHRLVTALGLLAMLVAACGPAGGASQPAPAVGQASAAGSTRLPPRPTAAPPALSAPSAPAATTRAAIPVRSPLRVRVGALGELSDTGLYVGLARGYYADQGLEPELTRFSTPGQLSQALAAGQVEVGALPISAALFETLGRGAALLMVADAGGAPPGAGAAGLVVRPDLAQDLSTPTDLRDLRIALPSRADSLEVELAALLRSGWLARTDVEMLTLPPAGIESALADAEIDGAMVAEPLLTQLEESGLARVWRRSDHILPNHLTAALFFSTRFAREQPGTARRYMTAYLRALRIYNDAFVKGKSGARADLLGIISRSTQLGDPPLLDRVVLPGINPNGMVNVQTLRLDQQYFLASGQQRRSIDLTAFIDSGFAAYAITQLGEYR